MQGCDGIWAGIWLTLPPTTHGLSFLDSEYPVLARFRLGLPWDPDGGPCRRGGGGERHPRGWCHPGVYMPPPARATLAHGPNATISSAMSFAVNRSGRAAGRKLDISILDSHTGRTCRISHCRYGTVSSRSTSLTRPRVVPISLRQSWAAPAPPSLRPFGPSAFVPLTLAARRPNVPFDLIPAVVGAYGGWHPEFAQF